MYTYSILSDRKLSRCRNSNGSQVGSDRYIELKNIEHFGEIWDLLNTRVIQTINSEQIQRINSLFVFKIIDTISNRKYKANITRTGSDSGIRLRVGEYADAINMIPGQIVTIGTEINNTDCIFNIKTEWIYRYIFERHAKSETYILRSQSCTNLQDEENFLEFINQFGISPTGNTVEEGRDKCEYQTYIVEACNSFYVGVPFTSSLPLDCFDKDKIKDRV